MPLIEYTAKKFNPIHTRIIEQANEIIQAYRKQGFSLTLRQLYYQFVSRDLFPESWADKATGSTNNERSYDKLGSIISAGRRAGLVDWDAIVDRTRNLVELSTWDSPSDIVVACSRQYRVDFWREQSSRPEVWIEKDALIGVVEGVCNRFRVPYFSCRGYTSDSEIWAAGQRLARHARGGHKPYVIHLGDHDPSGIDMSRDIGERLTMFARREIPVKRIALNMPQVLELNPPPNPAKVTDSRYETYRDEYGDESWELDALTPVYIANLIENEIQTLIDPAAWEDTEAEENNARERLQGAARWLEDQSAA